ncbi:MAG: tRNA (adenosine(37)-N6)-threonylcarbamoyltransferase complex ATPase subunit type 1 TsaE [Solirubrobacterales bacterium]|nr:tRNA (adenosine(37)-N6)-threonylcarbamoyltransferase complex ATPase subunit type 1 TsaE [Solirubrobacterales bacterium]
MTGTVTEITALGADATEAAGRELAARLEPGDVVLFSGDVGAGKSTMIRATMRELGVAGPIPSPTFTIGRSYEEPGQTAPIAHLDLYRLGGLEGEDPGLLAEYFGPDRITFVEWPGEAEVELSEMATRIGRVAIDHVDAGSRRITVGPLRPVKS